MREFFPALQQKINSQPLVYLDSAASTLKPQVVGDRVRDFLLNEASNVHRGAHYLSDVATGNYESARKTISCFIGSEESEVIFTAGTTDGINLLAYSLEAQLNPGDEILLTEMEHHSNLVPWQELAKRKDLKLKFVPVTESGELDYSSFEGLLTPRTRLFSFVHISNSLGTLNSVQELCDLCRSRGILTLVDAAQSVAAIPIDVKKLGCDFLVFSGHKIFGPYGVGVLFGRNELLNSLPPFRTGGSMISEVQFDSSSFLEAPQRFEAGTPNISGVIGLGEAIRFVDKIGFTKIREHEKNLTSQLLDATGSVEGVELVGSPKERLNVVSFTAKWGHPSDVGQLLDQQGIAVRTGHHCTQPLLEKLGVSGTIRASVSIYNDESDIMRFIESLEKARKMLT